MSSKIVRKMLTLMEMLSGTALTAGAFTMVILPQNFAAGGVTGFSKIINRACGFSVSMMVLTINLILLLAGLVFVGKAFAAKTVMLSVAFPCMMEASYFLPVLSCDAAPVLGVIVGGVMLGVGVGMVLRSGASSGGFDIVAVILHRKFGISIAAIMNICDCTVILLQAVGQPLSKTVYGVAVIMLSSLVVHQVVLWRSKQIAPSYPMNLISAQVID